MHNAPWTCIPLVCWKHGAGSWASLAAVIMHNRTTLDRALVGVADYILSADESRCEADTADILPGGRT